MSDTKRPAVTGWGAIALDPWHFAGLFTSRDEAEERASEMGPNYVVRFGDNPVGTDRFRWMPVAE